VVRSLVASLVVALVVYSAFMGHGSVFAQWEGQPAASQVTPDPWPKVLKQGDVTYTLYQPQVDDWDHYTVSAHAAVSALPDGTKEPQFGVIETTAKTDVDKLSRVVHFRDVMVTKATFPSAPDQAAFYQHGFQTMVAGGPSTMSLDRFQAALSVEHALKLGQSLPVKNDAPKIVLTPRSSVLVTIDGEPVWRKVEGTSLERVLNSRALILLDDTSGTYYIRLYDGFVQAKSLSGPWVPATKAPKGANELTAQLVKQKIIDPMTGPSDTKLSLKTSLPDVIVATTPTEILITSGTPDWVPINGTMLLYVKNTTGNIFKDLNTQMTYVLVTGRWFSAHDLAGPWEYVPAKELPPDFARIPDDNPKENVKASIPGTAQAQEMVIANEIPQTARVYRAKATFVPVIDGGAPVLKPIPDTSLMYVFNSPMPIIRLGPYEWYGVHGGVWFTASSLKGPWVVATAIPAVIYSIPVSSPLHYVTYVRIYTATPEYVVVGYTPGYFGTIVTSDGLVVYGTGYTYVGYTGVTVWYGAPVTYGYAASVTWTPWTSWAVGFGFGWAMGATWGTTCCWGYAPAPYWGPMPYAPYGVAYAGGVYGAAAWGPGGWAATSGNVYSQWGATTAVSRSSAGYNAWTGNAWTSKVGTSYNSVTGRSSAGQSASVQNVYTGNYAYGQRGATYNPSTGVTARGGSVTTGNAYTGQQESARYGQVTGPGGQTAGAAHVGNDYYADHDGTVYRNTGSGWQQYNNGSWSSVNNSATQSLQSSESARAAGDARSAGSSWGSNSWGSGFGGSSAAGSSGGAGGWDRGSGGHTWGGGGGWGGGRFVGRR